MHTIGLIVKKQAANAAKDSNKSKGKGKGKKSADVTADPQGPFLEDVVPEEDEDEAEAEVEDSEE